MRSLYYWVSMQKNIWIIIYFNRKHKITLVLVIHINKIANLTFCYIIINYWLQFQFRFVELNKLSNDNYKTAMFVILALALQMLLLMLSSSFSSSAFFFLFIKTSAVCKNLLLSDLSILYPELYEFSFLADLTVALLFFGWESIRSIITISFWIWVFRSQITFRCWMSVFKLLLSSLNYSWSSLTWSLALKLTLLTLSICFKFLYLTLSYSDKGSQTSA